MRVDAHAMEIRLSCVERLDASSCMPCGQQIQPFIQVGAADAHGRAVCHAGGKSSGAYVGADYFGGDSGQRFRFGHAKQWTVLNGYVWFFVVHDAVYARCLCRCRRMVRHLGDDDGVGTNRATVTEVIVFFGRNPVRIVPRNAVTSVTID